MWSRSERAPDRRQRGRRQGTQGLACLGPGAGDIRDGTLGPRQGVVPADSFQQGGLPFGPLVLGHLERTFEGIGGTGLIVWVDPDRLAHLTRSAGKFAEQEDTGPVALTGDVLLGHQVHAITK